jgi:hypothetical protein
LIIFITFILSICLKRSNVFLIFEEVNMKRLKIIIIIVVMASVVLLSVNCGAVSDPQDDVLYWNGVDWNNWQWNVMDRPNVDIVDISYDAGNRLTITMTIEGSFNMDNSMYHIWYNTSDAYYYLHYSPYIETEDEPIAIAFPIDFENWTIEQLMNWTQPETEASISGNILTGIFDWATEDHTMNEFYAWAQEWENVGDQFTKFWVDYVPNDFSPYTEYETEGNGNGNGEVSNGDGTGGNGEPDGTGTPGFELLTLMAAIGASFILLRRRK